MKETKTMRRFFRNLVVVLYPIIAFFMLDRYVFPLIPGLYRFQAIQTDLISVGKPGGPQILIEGMAGGANIFMNDAKGDAKISMWVSPKGGHPLVEVKAGAKGYVRIDAMNKSDRPSITLGDPATGAARWKVTLDDQGRPVVTERHPSPAPEPGEAHSPP